MTSTQDYARLREQMIQQQLRTSGVLDAAVLHSFAMTPREAFVASAEAALAYADRPAPISPGRCMFTPREQGLALQALHLKPTDHALNLGCGTGYMAALMSHLCATVLCVDPDATLLAKAELLTREQHAKHLQFQLAQAIDDLPADRLFDAILVEGSLNHVPDRLKHILAPKGRLFIVTGTSPVMQARLFTRMDEENFEDVILFETLAPRLYHESHIHFVF